MWWQALIRAVILGGVIVGLATASYGMSREEAYIHARWAGMDAKTDFSFSRGDDPHALNGFYIPEGVYCFWLFCQAYPETVVLIQGVETPDDLALYVLFHELGHYQQARAHPGKELESGIDLEWEADVIALNTLCAYHYNGPSIMQRAYTYVALWFGYTGDSGHGSGLDRVAYATERAWVCHGKDERP